MKKLFFAFLLPLFLLLPSIASAWDIQSIIDYVEANYEVHSLTNNCVEPQPSYDKNFDLVGVFCGPTAVTDAGNAVGGGGIRRNLQLAPNLAGFYYKQVSSTTTTGYCDYVANPGTPIQTSYTEDHYIYAVFCTYCDNCDTYDQKYCVTKGWACAGGAAAAIEYEVCEKLDGMYIPTGQKSICGNAAVAQGIDNGSIPGQVFTDECGCDKTLDEVLAMCDQIDPNLSTCDDCSTKDDDGDGVNNCDDHCPDTPAGLPVSQYGCSGADSDGDGVADGWDHCPGTEPGTAVDQFGCPKTIDTEVDSDNDGVPDYADNCSNSPPGASVDINGCPVETGPNPDNDGDGLPDADSDNDTPLLSAILSWIKGLDGDLKQTNKKLDGIGNKIDDTNSTLDALKDDFEDFSDTSGVDTTLPNDQDFDGNLPDDFTPVDLEQNFLSDLFDSLIQNNAFIQQIKGSTLEASGSCSLSCSVTVFGRSVPLNFSLCDYDLSAWRVVMLVVAGLVAFFIVFRKN